MQPGAMVVDHPVDLKSDFADLLAAKALMYVADLGCDPGKALQGFLAGIRIKWRLVLEYLSKFWDDVDIVHL